MRSWKGWPLVLLSISVLCSCTGVGDDPRELLNQAVSSVMAMDDFGFDGISSMHVSDVQLERDVRFTGEVRGHNEIIIQPSGTRGIVTSASQQHTQYHYAKVNKRWTTSGSTTDKQLSPLYTVNPLIHAEHLNKAMKEVKVENELTVDGMTILSATFEEEQLARKFKEQLRTEHEALIQSALEEARRTEHKQLEEELRKYAEQAQQQLDQILDSLAIRFDYRLKVHRRERSLREMDVVAGLHYTLDGDPRVETIRTSYRFRP